MKIFSLLISILLSIDSSAQQKLYNKAANSIYEPVSSGRKATTFEIIRKEKDTVFVITKNSNKLRIHSDC
jgi:hypothetical protein